MLRTLQDTLREMSRPPRPMSAGLHRAIQSRYARLLDAARAIEAEDALAPDPLLQQAARRIRERAAGLLGEV